MRNMKDMRKAGEFFLDGINKIYMIFEKGI